MENRVTLKEAGRGARKEALKNAAGSLFAETGYEGTTIEAIAQNAGMAKGSFYLHFESKEEIFRALIEDASERIIERTSDVARSTGSISEKLEKIAEIILSFHLGSSHPWFFTFMEKGIDRQEVMEHFYVKRKKVIDVISGIFRKGMDEGMVVVDDPDRLSNLFLGCINGTVVRGCCSHEEISPDQEAGWLVARFLEGAGT
jgi:AcrR family transcriptional regulator